MAAIAAPDQAHVRSAIVLDQLEGAAIRQDRDALQGWHSGSGLSDQELGEKLLKALAKSVPWEAELELKEGKE